ISAPARVVFIYPAYAGMSKLLLRLLEWKPGIRLICIIGDIDGIKDGNDKKLRIDIKHLRRYSYFVVHNVAMQIWLQRHIKKSKSTVLEFFDFLATPVHNEGKLSSDIVFAGLLEKSKFLESLYLLSNNPASFLQFNLYGQGFTASMAMQKKVTWFGSEKPYDLPGKLKGSFGLVWDGDSIDKPAGSLGNYMQFISHHKVSLYILSGLPLIVPASAGTAPLVEKYKIGIIINSLYEIDERLRCISEEEYNEMKKNMQPLAKKISSGGCIKDALQKLLFEICVSQ
ncbi:MAG: hypothetical protein ACSLE0_10775, partial [Chitinophagaceae bacterium]